ncbi:hypothetical protein [Corallococcus caeni]|uniref:Uncharacterized protein n=1 Tax=Corallococcus caeni TaxID=3082388 RepID=A0ABQ6QMN7_9BACT|nr:hypothetical protein ASNO1_15110 [Corallococcus sp. NO1]
MSDPSPLAPYPVLLALQQKWGAGAAAAQELIDHGSYSMPLLGDVLRRIPPGDSPSLRGLVDDLFSANGKKIHAALCEFLVFGWLHERGLLSGADIGYPQDWKGEDPPFEGCLRLGALDLPFDVKDGSGVGLMTLERILRKEAARFGAPSTSVPPISVAVDAPSGQKWVEDNFEAIVEPFRKDLKAHGFAPRLLELKAGSGFVKVGIDHKVGASVAGIQEKGSYIGAQILDHALGKAAKLKLTASNQFLLIYLKRPYSGPSDFDLFTAEYAFDFLVSQRDLPASLAGALFIEFESVEGHFQPSSLLWDRNTTLPERLREGAQRLHIPSPRLMPKDRQAAARALNPDDIAPTACVFAGSCELRGANCEAPGSTGPVFVFVTGDDNYCACRTCRVEFGWPPLT